MKVELLYLYYNQSRSLKMNYDWTQAEIDKMLKEYKEKHKKTSYCKHGKGY